MPGEAEALASSAERVHLDGARLANAAVALGVPLADLAAPADTVAFSLNKGLCAPFGAMLAGEAAVIEHARAHLKRLGGATVHKAGILAAAGLVALGLVDRLAEDHRRARVLAELLGLPEPETNIVLTNLDAEALPRLAALGVLAFAPDGRRVRLVTHRGIDDRQIGDAAAAILSL
jgi:threonine aldolase